ncbi:stage V sporulation protein AC [Phosphitispora sp. TUW77]|uniref:stage V sporulation protein AC n=1 Tax=Phosphitispora sp. TUW77 TaxID=3152361 RepID=UPI003AB530E1
MKQDQMMFSEHEIQKKMYSEMVARTKPKPPVLRNVIGAFFFGGAICTLGQALVNFYISMGLPKPGAGAAASATLVFLAALLTGLGVYDSMAKYAGAGTIVPITGFANSIVAPAMEYRREGMVFGVGQRMFTIAGPVLAYGFISAWMVGLITYLFK